MMKRISVCVALLAAFISCADYDVNEVLLVRDDVSLTVRGKVQFRYDAATCQLGYNPDRSGFRAYDDNLGDWFVLECGSSPDTEGIAVKANLEYTTSDSKRSLEGLTFVVKKRDSRGYVWLWNDSDKIGIVVRMLE